MDEFSSMNLLLSVIAVNTAISGRNRIQILPRSGGSFLRFKGAGEKICTNLLFGTVIFVFILAIHGSSLAWRTFDFIFGHFVRKIITGGFNALGFTFYRGVRTINLPAVAIG
jgi:hypothetical protein